MQPSLFILTTWVTQNIENNNHMPGLKKLSISRYWMYVESNFYTLK